MEERVKYLEEKAGKPHFYTPLSKDQGHIVLPLSVRPSVCLHKLNVKTLHFPITPKLIYLQGSYLV